MNEDEIRKTIEQIDPEGQISQSQIEELVAAMKELGTNPSKEVETSGDYTFLSGNTGEENLREQIAKEPDWRKRAALSARIISKGLE